MSEGDNILARIREALRFPAPQPGNKHNGSPIPIKGSPVDPRPWLPASGATLEERLALFQKNSTDLKAQFRAVADRQELAVRLRELRDAESWKKVGAHRGELTDFACETLGLPVCCTEGGYPVQELESCDAGITECDALIAQTGSVLLTSRSAGGRALSVLPPHHVVLARRSQVLPDLLEGFRLLKVRYGSDYPSFMSFTTGPSRTGDIERILVLGAHGPKKLTIFCV